MLTLHSAVRVLLSGVCGTIVAAKGGRLCVETPDGRFSWHFANELSKTELGR